MKKLMSFFAALLVHTQLSAQDTQAYPLPPEQGFTQTLIMVSVGLFFFYFILFRPEQKRRKQLEAQRSAMKKGDQVNIMGILGHVAQIKDQTVIVRMVDGSKIEVLKVAISEIIPTHEEAKEV